MWFTVNEHHFSSSDSHLGTLFWHSFEISDIPSGSVYINIWHIHVAIPSDILSCIYIDILSDIRSGIYILKCFLAYILTFFPAYSLASFWHSLWLFFWHPIWHLFWHPFFLAFYLTFPLASGWGPAVLAEIWSSQDEGQEEEEEETTLIKSRDLHLAGGEPHIWWVYQPTAKDLWFGMF